MSGLPPPLVAGLLALGALVLVAPGPWWVARWSFLARVPRAGVVLWQAGAVAALICVFGVAAIALRTAPAPDGVGSGTSWWSPAVVAAAAGFAVLVAARLIWSLVRVIAETGARRRRHRTLIDLVADPGAPTGPVGVRVLAESRPLAYCLPGLRTSRVVLSAGALAMLGADELAAVLAHERAHLRARHDVVLATFDAVHQAFPHVIRSELPAQQSRLLVEMLADDAAVRAVGAAPLGRALVALAGSTVPAEGLGAGPLSTRVRLERLAAADGRRTGWLSAGVYALALGLVASPVLALLAAT